MHRPPTVPVDCMSVDRTHVNFIPLRWIINVRKTSQQCLQVRPKTCLPSWRTCHLFSFSIARFNNALCTLFINQKSKWIKEKGTMENVARSFRFLSQGQCTGVPQGDLRLPPPSSIWSDSLQYSSCRALTTAVVRSTEFKIVNVYWKYLHPSPSHGS